MKQATTTAPPGGRHNPWVGPREFGRDDRLPNRERQARALTDRIVADRVVLLHSPSGAGKTSLIEAAVVKLLAEEGFVPTPRLRVNQPPQKGADYNPYIHSLVTYLLSEPNGLEPPTEMSLKEAVQRWRAIQSASGKTDDGLLTVLIIDQLEEVLIIDPTDWDTKERFFRELGALLQDEPIWAVLSMREDYMGGLDRYLRFLPGLLRSRYRLDFLNRFDAKLAMTVPAKEQHVDFDLRAADELVDRLSLVEIQRPGREPETVKAPYVEPFHLQVVCRQMWKKIRVHRGDDFPAIGVDDVRKYADLDQALTSYVGDTVASVVKQTRADEHKIRDWLEYELITKQNLRGQTLSRPDTADAAEVVVLLDEGYLIRADLRGQSTWYELTHDRLIRAVQNSNEMWRWNNLEPWQIAAHEWNARDRHPAFLLSADALPSSPIRDRLTDVEKAFLKASETKKRDTVVVAWMSGMMRIFAVTAAIEAIAIIALLIVLLVR